MPLLQFTMGSSKKYRDLSPAEAREQMRSRQLKHTMGIVIKDKLRPAEVTVKIEPFRSRVFEGDSKFDKLVSL